MQNEDGIYLNNNRYQALKIFRGFTLCNSTDNCSSDNNTLHKNKREETVFSMMLQT